MTITSVDRTARWASLVMLLAAGLALPNGARAAAGVDCSWFVYQEEAQETLSLGPMFAPKLDEDSDGIACNDLPSRQPLAVPDHHLPPESDATMGVVTTDDAISVVRNVVDFSTVRLFGIEPLVAFDKMDALPAECVRFLSRRRIGDALMIYDHTPVWVEAEPSAAPDGGAWIWFRGHDDPGPYLLNEMLVRDGSARVTNDAAKSTYGSRLLAAQGAAKAEGAGFWGPCGAGFVQADGAPATPGGASRTFSGTGDTVTEPIVVNGSPLTLNANYQGDGNFAVWAVHQDGQRDLLFNEIGPYQGQAILTSDQPDEVVLQIQAAGAWRISIHAAF